MHSSFCSLFLEISLCIAEICCFICLIFCMRSCFSLVFSSATFMALWALASLACKNVSNLVTSSSSICWLLFSACSFILVFSSSFRISCLFTFKDICTRNISLFLATKSMMFSFSRLGSRPIVAAPGWSPASLRASPGVGTGMSSSFSRRLRCTRDEAVVFSQTFSLLYISLSSARFLRSCSRIRKIWSSGGSRNGLPPSSSSMALGESL
mmetsp:Transcript_92181/g.246450  ORF Transcript_92181/g.246450 Transcript_92181/m.246450 type:complete len:210 (-) Transcript_92181:42-671(-)